MEVKNWTYEEFPEYTEEVEGAVRILTTGTEIGVYYRPDIEYAKIDGVLSYAGSGITSGNDRTWNKRPYRKYRTECEPFFLKADISGITLFF